MPFLTSSPSHAADAVFVEGLTKTFKASGGRRQQVLNGVNFAAKAGAVTTLLGTNGAGKSTSLACAQGLLEPDAGTVRLLGSDPWRAPATLRARVGVMLQDGGLPPAQKPLGYLKHVAGLYASPADVDTLAQRLGLDAFASTPIRRLSGGQKQRVALAVALVGEPEVLFLDEPSAGLDPQSRQVVFELIEEQRDLGRAIVLTTHLLEDAERLSDTVYVIDRGRTVASGTVDDLIGHDAPPTLTVSFPPGASPTWPDGVSPRREGGAWVLDDVTSPALLASLSARWDSEGIMPSSLRLERRTLEEAFLSLAAQAADTEALASGTIDGTHA